MAEQATASLSNQPSGGVTFDAQPTPATPPAQGSSPVIFDTTPTQNTPPQGSETDKILAGQSSDSGPKPFSQDSDFNTGAYDTEAPTLANRLLEHGVDPAAHLIGGQIQHMVTTPINAYHEAIEAYQKGDWKGATMAASKVINAPSAYGLDTDSPIYKALSEIVMQPVKQVAESYKQNRAAGAGPVTAGIETANSTLNAIPNSTEIGNIVGNIKQDVTDKNWAGILGDAVGDLTTSKGASAIPVVGGALASGGKDFNKDMHDHNYMAAVGDVLGTILPFGLGKLGEGEEAAAGGGTPPRSTTGVEPPPKVGSNSIRPTTTQVAGVNIPQAAEPGTGIVGKAARTMRSMASEDGAKKFVEEHVQPAARKATTSNFIGHGLSDVDTLRELQGEPNTTEVPPAGIKSVADIADFMHNEARETYKKLDDAAQEAVDEWEGKYGEEGTVTQAYAKAMADAKASVEGTNNPPPVVPKPIVPPRPKLFTELQDQIRNAHRVIDSEFTQQVDKQAAIDAIPKYYAERTKFLNDNSDIVSKGELAQADKVYAKGVRYDWIADRLDALTKNTGAGEQFGSTGATPVMNINSLDKLPTMFDRKFGRDSFVDLVGNSGAKNFNAIESALRDPVTGSKFQTWLNELPLGVGKLATIPVSTLTDRIMFDPTFGKTVLKAFDKVKEGGQAARDASFDAVRKAGSPAYGAGNAAATPKTDKKQVISNALGGARKKLTALSDGNPPAAATDVPDQVQNAVSTIPVEIKQGAPISDPNNRGGGVPIANVDQGAGNNTIEVNRPQDFDAAQKGHELVHVWQNNLPPSVQAKIPDDPNDTSAFDISDVDKLRKQGKTLVDIPREKAATIVQKYIEAKDPKTKAKLQPWVDDMKSSSLSTTMPTAPDAKRLNMTPRPPGLPDRSVAGVR